MMMGGWMGIHVHTDFSDSSPASAGPPCPARPEESLGYTYRARGGGLTLDDVCPCAVVMGFLDSLVGWGWDLH